MDDFFLLWQDEGDVLADFFGRLGVVDVDTGEGIVEQVPQDRGGFGVLGEEKLDSLAGGYLLPGALPFFDEGLGFGHQDRGVLAFGGGADDSSVITGQNALHEGFEPALFLPGRDLLGDADLVCERQQYDVASCQ